jgi:ABC-type uncharacterized transport system permease subunit
MANKPQIKEIKVLLLSVEVQELYSFILFKAQGLFVVYLYHQVSLGVLAVLIVVTDKRNVHNKYAH